MLLLVVKVSVFVVLEVDSDMLLFLCYSVYVYVLLLEKCSIVLNGKVWMEGDLFLFNLVVEQIQQDVMIFSFNGMIFIFVVLEDWLGGKIDEELKEE